MPDIESVIGGELEDPRAVFVFHNEVTARFWLRRAFRLTSRRTLPEDRFVDWDGFRRQTMLYPAGRREATPAWRTLFLAGLLEENRREPFLQRLIPPEYRENSIAFLRFLAGCLPMLPRVRELGPGMLDPAKKSDLLALLQRYLEHLVRGGLYEPAYEQPRFEPRGRRYLLFCRELLEDYGFYEELLKGRAEVRVVEGDPPADPPDPPWLEACEATPEEFARALLRVGSLLEAGLPPEEIVLTVAGLEEAEPTLRLLAARYGIPLSFRSTRPVTRYPQARLFASLLAVADSGFDLQLLKALLLNRAFPWRESLPVAELLRLGIENRVFRNHELRGRRLDMWEENLGRAAALHAGEGRPQEAERVRSCLRFYRRLREETAGICRAGGLRELRDRLLAFTDHFLDLERWSEEQRRVYRYALDTLNDLLFIGDGTDCGPPLQVWLEYLEDRRYVPQEDRAGVAVYSYGVSAGIRPEHHFILNTSQEGTRRVVHRYPFLSDQEGPAEARQLDLSAEYLRLYAASGRQVHFSYSRTSAQGAQLPADFFLAGGRVGSAGPAAEAASWADPYRLELSLWRGEDGGPAPGREALTRLTARQREGFLRARRTGLGARGLDLGRRRLGDEPLRRQVRERLRSREGELVISASALEDYAACPFRYLFQRGLGIEELEFRPAGVEATEFGSLMHRVFERFYRLLQGQPLETGRLEEYRRLIRQEAEAVLAGYEAEQPLPFAPAWDDVRRDVLALSAVFPERELEEFPGQVVLETERSFEASVPGEGVRLAGRIDRVSRVDGLVGLVDYKKNSVPAAKEIFGEEPTSFQVPFYLYLLRRQGLDPQWAAYYSMQKGRYTLLFHPRRKAAVGLEEVERAVANLEETVRRMAAGIRDGDYRLPGAIGKAACRYCTLRGLCRDKFVPWE